METRITITADMNDILFEGKNKSYGAYEIRKNYGKTILNSFYMAAIATLTVILFFYGSFRPPEKPEMISTIPVEMDSIPTIQKQQDKPKEDKKIEDEKPKGDPKTEEKPIAAQKFVAPKPSKDVEDSVTIRAMDSLEGNIDTADTKGCKDCKPPVDPRGCDTCDGTPKTVKPIIEPLSPDKVDVMVEVLNLADIKKCINYPDALKGMGMEGDVFMRVTIGENDEIENIEIKRSSHVLFSKAVQACIPNLKAKAGIKDGHKVKSWVIIPFKFQLNR